MIEIGNSKMYTKPDEKCPKCGIPLNAGVVFHNVPKNCEEYITYPYMEIGQSMHMECYIHLVIETCLNHKPII